MIVKVADAVPIMVPDGRGKLMGNYYRAILLAALIGLVYCAGSASSQVKSKKAQSSKPCPDEIAWTGKYKNHSYRFSVVIPPGRKGFWNSDRCVKEGTLCVCMTDHGRFIPLSDGAGIEVFAGYQTDPEWFAADYEDYEIAALKKRAGVEHVEVLSSRQIRLSSLTGKRFVVRFNETKKAWIEDHIIALYQDLEYELIFRTPESRYQQDKLEFERVMKSWRVHTNR